MRIQFTNDILESRNNVSFLVEGVGTAIQFINDSSFDTQTNSAQAIPDYITIQRGSKDGNPWSTRNRWFHKDLIQNLDQTSSSLVQAHRPIIEFFRNMQLYDFGNYARANVDLVYNLGNIQNLTAQPGGTTVDGIVVQDNDRILVINDQDPERTNRIFRVYGIGNANAISLSIETDGQNRFGQPVEGETVYVNSGSEYGGSYYYYNGTTWVIGQEKTTYNQFPLYYLYDDNGIALDDQIEYPSSTFSGSTLFQYDLSNTAAIDPILGLPVVLDGFGAPEFTNTLENITYTYLSDFLTTNISGYYFAYSYGESEYLNHWHKSPTDSKQYILDQFIIGNQQNTAPSFTLKAATAGINIAGFVFGGGLDGVGDQLTNVDLSSGIIDGILDWSIGDQVLVKDQFNGAQNGIYEYVSGQPNYATLIRPAWFDKTSQVMFDMSVAITQGTINANSNFVMIQSEPLDWEFIPMLWSIQTSAYGLQRIYDLSQSPLSVAKYNVNTISTNNVPNFIAGTGPDGIGDAFVGINLDNTFDNTISYYYGTTILIMNQTLGYQNGLYVFSSGSVDDATLTRADYYDETSQIINGDTFLVVSGQYLNYMYEYQQTETLDWSTVPLIFNKVPKPQDNVIVELNGATLINNQDFTIITGNVLNLSLTLSINTDDLLQVWTYSTTGPVPNYTGFYEIPLNLESNANNAYVTTARFDDLLPHFSTIIQNQLDFSGTALGDNNYRDTQQNLGLGTGILQHSAPMLKLMMVNSLAATNIMTSMQYVESEYARFYNKFFNIINQLQNQGYTSATSYQDWVIAALNQINIGKNSTFPFASNNVGNGNYYIPPSPAFLGITPIYRPQKFIDYTANTPLRVIRFHDGQLRPAYDNPLTSPPTNLNQTIVATGTDTYDLNYNLVYSWEIVVEANNSPLIPEVDYTVSTGSTLPFLVLLNPLPAGTSLYVEWSNSILDNVILYLETMIYDSINSTFKQSSTNLTSGNVYYSPLQERPGYFRNTDFNREEWNEISQLDFNRWVSTNKVSLDVSSIYNEANPFTWNYSGVLDPSGNNLPGFWRGIYFYFYDTDRPNTNPWEMLGFTEKPFWWNTVYGPAPYTNSNYALWNDIQNGTIQQGSRAGTYDYLARPGIMNYIPVDSNGNLLDPITIGIATSAPLMPISASVQSDYMIYANAPFVFGDLGPVEYAWRCSANFSYGLSETMYLVKPPKFVEYFWEANYFKRIFPLQEENQLIIDDPIAGIDNRPPNSEAVIYTENSADVIVGVQQNIVDFLISAGKTATFLGDRIRGANAHLAYRASGFIDAQNMTASVDSFGDQSVNNSTLNLMQPNSLIVPEDNLSADSLIIPSDDIRVTLHTSSAIQEVSYSAILIKNISDYYEVSGYDFTNQYFKYYKPITTSSSMSVNVGGKQPNLTPWAPGIVYTVGTYVTYNNKIYRAVTQNISGNNFLGDVEYWLLVQSVPLIGGINVLKYSQYESTPTILPYNTRFFTPQDIANFVYGYENYLQTQGWQFNSINSDGSVNDFSYMLNQILSWIIADSSTNNIIIVSPLSALATFTSALGYADNLQNNISGMPTVLDRLGFAIPLNKLTVTRFDNTFTVQPVASNTDQQIYALKLNIVVIEHVVVFDDTTDFDDIIYDPLLDVRQERIYLSVVRALNWTGKFSAPGFLINNDGLSANFDKSVEDFTKFYDPNTEISASDIGLAAKALFGFQKKQSLTNLLMNEQEQFKFYQGFLREKGTLPSFNKLLRSSYVSDLNDVDFYEEWAVRLGMYGATEEESIIEIGLVQDDIRNNPQIIQFTSTTYQDPASNIIQIGPNDPRYLYKNFNNLTVNQFKTENIRPSLPTAGYAMLTDATLLVPNYTDLPDAVTTYLQTNAFTNAQRIWTAIDKDGYDWDMDRIDTVANLLSITQTSSSSPFVVTMNVNPGLTENEIVILQNCSASSNNGLYFANNITEVPIVGTEEALTVITGSARITTTLGASGNIVLNGITVALLSTHTLAQIVSVINSFTNESIIASSSASNLVLTEIAGAEIIVSGDSGVLTALGIAADTYGLGASGSLYIDNIAVSISATNSILDIIQSINTASIPNIVASENNFNLVITNTAGLSSSIGSSSTTEVLDVLGLVAEQTTLYTFDLLDINGNNAVGLQTEKDTAPYPQVLRLHNCHFKNSSTSIMGTIQNPTLIENLTFTINGITVNLISGNQILDIISAINSASIPNVTAYNFYGKLQLLNSIDDDILLSPWSIPQLGIQSTTPISGWDDINDLWFFDDYDNTGLWAITLPTDVLVRQQRPQIDSNYIKFVALMDGLTNLKLLDLYVYNPYQGIIPRNVEQQIDFKLDKDPAQYNDGSDTNAQQSGLAWVDEQVGRVWWDLSQVRFLNYDQGDLLYQYNNWGATFPGTKVALYEWISSPVTPDNWTAYVTTGDGTNLYSATSTPKYIDRYVTVQQYDPVQGATVPVYYFWLGNNNLIPQVNFRTIDLVTMQSIITNPTSQGVAWFSPIDSDICLVSGTESLLSDTTLLQIATNNYKSRSKRHTHWALIRENETITPPPSELWEKMKDSLVTFVQISGTLPYLESNGISSELFATLTAEGNVTEQATNYTPPIYTVDLPVPDPILLERQAYGNLYRPRQSWFNDPMSAREKFVQIANSLMSQTNWVDVNEQWAENISIQAQLFETPDYTVGTLAEMYALLTTPNFNNGSTVYVISDVTINGNWSFWQYNSSLSTKFVRLEIQSFNTNLFWERVDWYASGYDSSIITAQNVLKFATLADRNSYSGTFAVGQIVYIIDNGDGTWAAYTYNGLDNNIASWTLVAHQEATINFLENLYDFSTVSASNLAFAQKSASTAMINIINGFYQNLSTVQNQNQVTVGLIREAYRQNVSVDWAFKTSYISAIGLEEPLAQNFLYQPDQSDNIFDFLNTTKPFHTKFRGLIEKKTTADDTSSVNAVDTLDETITLRFDAVSVQPDQNLIQSVLSMPQSTPAEKQARQAAMSTQFTEAERIAIFTNYNPSDVLPGANYRGLDIDGVNFNDFSTLFAISPGYDNSPYDNILGYDFDQTGPMNLYDIYINGQSFKNNSITTIIDGDKFIQPYLAEGHPEELVLTQSRDVLNLSVYTQDVSGQSGYDVFGYDAEVPIDITGNLTEGSNTITNIPSTVGLSIGMGVTDNTNLIPPLSTILSIDSATQITMTNPGSTFVAGTLSDAAITIVTEGYDYEAPAASIFLGVRLFKNVAEQWQFLRISDAASTTLTAALTPYDTEVVLNDATVLSQPTPMQPEWQQNTAYTIGEQVFYSGYNYTATVAHTSTNKFEPLNWSVGIKRVPGVVFIGSERITFWQVDTTIPGLNKLQQILRGTSGTPWGENYAIGQVVRDVGENQNIPLNVWTVEYTPEGLCLDDSVFAKFLQAGAPATYNFS